MDINLNAIISDIVALQQQSPHLLYKAFLVKLESELRHYDAELQKFFQSFRQLQTASNNNTKTIISELHHEYLVLSRFFAETGQRVIDEANKTPDDKNYQNKLLQIGYNLISVSKLVPTYEKLKMASSDVLYDFAEALGAVYLKLGQSSLPTVAGHDDGKEAKADGICAGMVLKWAEQSVEQGTPNYPINSHLSVLDYQNNQFAICKKNYIPLSNKGEEISKFNLIIRLEGLQDNLPHYIAIGDSKKGRHALGIRKQKNNIEIMDPNYGNFFFRDIQTASIWFAILLQRYNFNQFPTKRIWFYQYCSDQAIPENQFIANQVLDDAVIESYSPPGYQITRKLFKQHLSDIIHQSSDKNLFSQVANALKYFPYCLTDEDTIRLKQFITAIKNRSLYDEIYSHFINQHDYDLLLSKLENRSLKETKFFDKLTLISEKPYQVLPPANLAILQDIKQLAQRTMQEAYELETELASLDQKNPEHSESIQRLMIKRDILNHVRKKIRTNKIQAKLMAGFHGKLNYSVEDAKQEIELLFGDLHPTEETKLIGQIHFLKNALNSLDAELQKELILINEDLYSHFKKVLREKKRDIITQLKGYCDEMYDAVISKTDYTAVLEKIISVPDFSDLPSLNIESPTYVEKLNTYLDNQVSKPYLDKDMKILNNLFILFDETSSDSVQAALNKEIQKIPDQTTIKIYRDLIKSANAFRILLIKALKDDEKQPVNYFIDLARIILPGINDQGCYDASEYDFSSHIRSIQQEQNIRESTDSSNSPDTLQETPIFTGENNFMDELPKKPLLPSQPPSAANLPPAGQSDDASVKHQQIEQIETIINDSVFWRKKTYFHRAPTGVREMRKILAQESFNDEDSKLSSLATIAKKRTKRSAFSCCFFSNPFRNQTTATLYRLIQDLDKDSEYSNDFNKITTEHRKYSSK